MNWDAQYGMADAVGVISELLENNNAPYSVVFISGDEPQIVLYKNNKEVARSGV